MSVFVKRSGLALVVAALCLAARTASAQTADVTYSSWPVGFQSNLTVGQGSNIYGSFAGLDGSDARGGFSKARINFPNGWFVGGGTGAMGFGMNGISQTSAFGSSLYTEGAQAGYKFQNAPLAVYAGFDTLKYKPGIGSPFAPFDTTSATLPGYRAHAGVEFSPAPNLSLSLELGYTQAPARSDIDSLVLPGASPFGRR
jgi:opacity protein-like surface antigen